MGRRDVVLVVLGEAVEGVELLVVDAQVSDPTGGLAEEVQRARRRSGLRRAVRAAEARALAAPATAPEPAQRRFGRARQEQALNGQDKSQTPKEKKGEKTLIRDRAENGKEGAKNNKEWNGRMSRASLLSYLRVLEIVLEGGLSHLASQVGDALLHVAPFLRRPHHGLHRRAEIRRQYAPARPLEAR